MSWLKNVCPMKWSIEIYNICYIYDWNIMNLYNCHNHQQCQNSPSRERKKEQQSMNLGRGFWGCESSVVWRFRVCLTEVSFSCADSAKTYVCENFNFSVILVIIFWPQLSLLHSSPFQTVRSQWWQSYTRSWFKICLWVRFDLVRTNRI